MLVFVLLAVIVASASASVDPFEAVPQLEPFKGFLPEWLNSSLYEVNADDLVILKEIIVNGTTVTGVPELLLALRANGGSNLFKIFSSAYGAVNKELAELPQEAMHIASVISDDLGQIAIEAIDDIDVEAVRNLAAKAVEAYDWLNAVGASTIVPSFEKAFPQTTKFLKDQDFRKLVKQTAKVTSDAVQG